MRKRKVLSVLVVCFLLSLAAVAWGKEAKAEFKVSGMSCAMCAKGVEAQLARLPGVKSATVSYNDGSATIVYDDAKLTVKEIREAIEKSGFKAEVKPGNDSGSGKSKGCCS